MGSKNCKSCKFSKDHFDKSLDLLDDDDVVECTWGPPALPYSWRYCLREVMDVHLTDGVDCPCFEQRQ